MKILTSRYYHESKLLLRIAIPLTLSGLAEASIAFSSTFFLARLGVAKLAAGALASWLFITLMITMWGTLTSVSVLISRYNGAQDSVAITRVLADSLLLALLLAIPASLIIWHGAIILAWFGQSKTIVTMTQSYLHGLTVGIVPDFIMLVLLQFTIGIGQTKINLWFALLSVPLNILLNYTLIFGKFGLPALDMGGIGWGTSCSYWLSTLVLTVFLLSKTEYRNYFRFNLAEKIRSHLPDLLRLGVPMGVMYSLEIGFFFVMALFMGRISYVELAAHQVVMQYFWQISIIISCLAQAVTIRISYSIGQKQAYYCKQILRTGIGLSCLLMALVGLVYCFSPDLILQVDFNLSDPKNQQLVKLAKQLLVLCALFQIIESVRFVTFGALRGLNDTRFSLYISIFTFWGIALPIGYCLAFKLILNGIGLWLGLILGALIGSMILQMRFGQKNNLLA